MMSWESAKKRTEVLYDVVSMLAIVIGGGYALWQYNDHVQAQRAKESFTFVERFYSAPISDAYFKLSTAWDRHALAVKKLRGKGDANYTKFIISTIKAERLERDIYMLLGFYEGVGLCIHHGWCDRRMAQTFFCESASLFFFLHYRFIALKRSEWSNPRFGAETERLVKKTCPPPESAGTAADKVA